MTIIVDAKSFAEAIRWTTKTYDAKDDRSFVALTVTEDGAGALAFQNNVSYLTANFTVLAEAEELSLALDGAKLQKLVGMLTSGNVALKSESGGLLVKPERGQFTIPVLSGKSPKAPSLTVLGEVDDTEFFDTLQRTSKMADKESAGSFPVLATVDIKLNAETQKASFMGTDRFALGETILDFTPSATEDAKEFFTNHKDILLASDTAGMVAPSKGLVTTTELVWDKPSGKFGYAFADGRIALFALKDANPIPYEGMKVKASEAVKFKATVETAALRKAISSIASFADEGDDVVISLSKKGLVVLDSKQVNKILVEVADTDAEDVITATFVRNVLDRAFSPVATNRVQIRWADSKSAFVIQPIDETGELVDTVFILAQPKVTAS